MTRIVVSDSKVIDLEGREALDGLDADIERTDARTPAEVIAAARGADALVVDAGTRVTGRVFEALDSLSVVGRAGTGLDNVDVDAAREHDVAVVYVPEYAAEEVATHALALLLACLRRVPGYDRAVRDGAWEWTEGRPIHRLAGGTVGVVGLGTIGRRFVHRLRGFDTEVRAYDPYVEDPPSDRVEMVTFREALEDADAVSVHAPLTEETRGLFDADAFAAIPDHAVLVNTARGPIVDETALEAALRSGRLGGAGLDVRVTEPPASSSLLSLDTVVSTPHVGWYSEQSRASLNRTLAADLARALRGESPAHPAPRSEPWR